MTLSPKLEQLMRELGPEGPRSLEHLEQAMMNIRFTGRTIIDWAGGRPKVIELGPPVRLLIAQGGLDTAQKTRSG